MSDADARSNHNQLIVEQFTRQAIPFSRMHTDQESIELLIDAAAVTRDDTVLDVACGPGIVACAFAAVAGHVVGIDITPAMLEQARVLQQSKGFKNLSWKIGDVTALPFGDGEFSGVVSRYALHHVMEPAVVLREMVRVCRPGGRVVVADVFTTSDAQGEKYDRMEKLRDPSHVRALQLDELRRRFVAAGAPPIRTDFYRFEADLEKLLEATCTGAVEAEQVRQLVSADVGKDEMGIAAHRVDGRLRFSFPVVVMAGKKA